MKYIYVRRGGGLRRYAHGHAELQLPINVIGVLAGCENMHGEPRAYRLVTC